MKNLIDSDTNNGTSHIFRDQQAGDRDEVAATLPPSLGPKTPLVASSGTVNPMDDHAVGIIFFSILILATSLLLLVSLFWIIRRRTGNTHRVIQFPINKKLLQKKVELRYCTIERWLITKQACDHDNFCEKLKVTLEQQPNRSEGPQSHLSNEFPTITKEIDCSICFESMTAGSIISWSANADCPHSFHHSCIKEWLLKHTSCPQCRSTFLLPDHYSCQKDRRTPDVVRQLQNTHKRRAACTFYCEKDGLFVLPSTITCSDEQKKELIQRLVCTVIPSADLKRERENHHDGNNTILSIPAVIELRMATTEESSTSPDEDEDLPSSVP